MFAARKHAQTLASYATEEARYKTVDTLAGENSYNRPRIACEVIAYWAVAVTLVAYV
jgi:hypothetical protein